MDSFKDNDKIVQLDDEEISEVGGGINMGIPNNPGIGFNNHQKISINDDTGSKSSITIDLF